MAESKRQGRVIEEALAYWRAVFDNPPLNIMGVAMFRELQELLARIDSSPELRVIVFESANPEFYLAHFDLTDIAGSLGLMQSAPWAQQTGRHGESVRRIAPEPPHVAGSE